MPDQLPPNVPRVMIDGQIEVRPGQIVPVLAQPSTRRLIVLNSGVVNQLEVGQPLLLQLPDEEPLAIVVEAVDRLSLIARYAPAPIEPPQV